MDFMVSYFIYTFEFGKGNINKFLCLAQYSINKNKYFDWVHKN